MIWKKAFKDFWATKSKTGLALFALFIGAWGLTTIVYTYSISKRDLHDNYIQTNPASVVLKVEQLNERLLKQINGLPYVADAEIRQAGVARIWKRKEEWMPVFVYSIQQFDQQKINTFRLQEGNYPATGEMVVERDGAQYLIDNHLKIQLQKNDEVNLQLSGTVHDPGLPPSHMDHIVWAYVNPATFRQLFKSDATARLLVTFSENRFDLPVIEKNTAQLIRWINTNGGNVTQSVIPSPGKHPHEAQLQSLLFLQLGIGMLAVLLSCILLINVISSIMSGQIKQIGMMKATGASYFQLVGLYLAGVAVLAIIALMIAMPLGYNTAIAYNKFIAHELNFNVINTHIPLWLNAALVFTLILLPIVTALLPINHSCRIPVKEALAHEKINPSSRKSRFSLGKKLNLPSWLNIGFSNVFRNKWGSALTIFNLMLGLALLMTSLNLRSSITHTFVNTLQNQKYSLSVSLDKPYPTSTIDSVIKQMPEVVKAEGWLSGSMTFAQNNIASNSISVTAFQDNSQLLMFAFLEGKLPQNWAHTIVVNPEFMEKYPHLSVGDSVQLFTHGQAHTWHIAGVIKEMGSARVYTTRAVWEMVIGTKNLASELKIQTPKGITGADMRILTLKLENQLKSKGMGITNSMNQTAVMQMLNDHIMVITMFLIAMSVLVLVVGGIGLISMMNINIMERKRETGIMRAIGGSTFSISQIIFGELLLLGLLSWLIGWAVSIPLSKIISDFFGNLIIHTELDFATEPMGFIITLLVVLAILLLSAIIPVRNASRIPVHVALTEN